MRTQRTVCTTTEPKHFCSVNVNDDSIHTCAAVGLSFYRVVCCLADIVPIQLYYAFGYFILSVSLSVSTSDLSACVCLSILNVRQNIPCIELDTCKIYSAYGFVSQCAVNSVCLLNNQRKLRRKSKQVSYANYRGCVCDFFIVRWNFLAYSSKCTATGFPLICHRKIGIKWSYHLISQTKSVHRHSINWNYFHAALKLDSLE